MSRFLPFLAIAALTLSACDSNDPVDDTADLTVQTATNIFAPIAAQPPGPPQPPTGPFTLYSLRTNSVVANADSASSTWDVGFRGSDIIVNGGASGPGNAAAVVQTNTFAEITEAPAESDFRIDGSTTCSNGNSYAICGGSGNGWYTYVPFPGNQGGYIVPTAGRTILVRTADGQGYAKVQIKSYYQNSPDPATITEQSPPRYYTFDYVLNASGRQFSVNS